MCWGEFGIHETGSIHAVRSHANRSNPGDHILRCRLEVESRCISVYK
jgi:hypothetical protein